MADCFGYLDRFGIGCEPWLIEIVQYLSICRSAISSAPRFWKRDIETPTCRVNCDWLNASVSRGGTVRQALRSLEQLGFIRRARGKGTLIISNEQAELPSSTNPIIVSLIVPHCRDLFVPTLLLGVEVAMRERSARLFLTIPKKASICRITP